VRGVFRPCREDGGLDRGHGVGRARLVGRQAGQILGGAIRCAGVVGCSIRWQRRCAGVVGCSNRSTRSVPARVPREVCRPATTSPPGGRWSWSRVESSRVESSLQLLASFCEMVTCCTWGGASRKLLDRLGRGTGMIRKPRQHYGGWNPCA